MQRLSEAETEERTIQLLCEGMEDFRRNRAYEDVSRLFNTNESSRNLLISLYNVIFRYGDVPVMDTLVKLNENFLASAKGEEVDRGVLHRSYQDLLLLFSSRSEGGRTILDSLCHLIRIHGAVLIVFSLIQLHKNLLVSSQNESHAAK